MAFGDIGHWGQRSRPGDSGLTLSKLVYLNAMMQSRIWDEGVRCNPASYKKNI